ncbi:cytochrome P450 [Streptomyces sp. NPDC058603]|uniref:cytochrome P450 family protein n=1 Tax=Streptomyces sp. NPDC058603 TaxID=3346551 RepID=UPI00365BAB0E
MNEILPSDYMTSPEYAADPYTPNAELRAKCPVHRIDFPPGAESFLVVDYEQVRAGFTDPRLSKRLDNGPAWFHQRMLENSPVLAYSMVTCDPPEQTRLRRLVSKTLTNQRMEALRPQIQKLTDDLIDAFPESAEVDMRGDFAVPLPLTVICELIGVPLEDRPQFREWAFVLNQSAFVDGEIARRRKAASAAVQEYFDRMMALRRADPRDDLITGIVQAADANGTFTNEELVSTLIFLLIAGHETTSNLIGNGILGLLRNPDQLALLRSDPTLMRSAIEEFLRYEGPVERGTPRFATEDMTVAGTEIPKGSFLLLSVGAADRDPAEFEDPDRLDITRSPNRHMGFGHGAHFCLGAPLARIEGEIAFETLLRRVPSMELAVAPEELKWMVDTSINHGLEELPVRIEGRRARGER